MEEPVAVTFHELLQSVMANLGPSLRAFRPEIVLCATILLLLLVRMVLPRWKAGAYYVMLLGTAAALSLALPAARYSVSDTGQIIAGRPLALFTGLLLLDSFSATLRVLLLLFGLLLVGFTRASGVPDPDDATEFYCLVLGALVGMCLMVSANHALLVLLGIEMASVPSYVLAGFLRHRRESSEAALKYAVFGGGTAGVMLYGISLLCGVLGSGHLPTMAQRLATCLHHPAGVEHNALVGVLMLGGLMWMVGLAFKITAVPFHFWAPDVFEGAPAEVGMFLSVASKTAALGLLARLALVFSTAGTPAATAALAPARLYLAGLLALLAAVTCTFGNLAAYGQTNIKRLLAYSTIAHAGYMMMPVAAAVALAGQGHQRPRDAVAALVVYLAVYLFMNFGAFAVVAFVRNARGSESIADYAGLVRRSPGLAVAMAVILFSLVGLPPLAGFSAKFGVFAALFDAGLLSLLVIGGANTVLSLFYYLRVVKVMVLDAEPEPRPAAVLPLVSVPGLYCAAAAAIVVAMFFWWDTLWQMGQAAASALVP
ncbi:MAG: NADH-quinone oxidoreductase subunit N [Thermoguttaceae bacterium]|jgi:NADH-quinone oxidoreductase subunit N